MDAPTVFAVAIFALTLLSTSLLVVVFIRMRLQATREKRRQAARETYLITSLLDSSSRGNRYIGHLRHRNA